MNARWGRAAVIQTLITCLCWTPGLSSDLVITESMGDEKWCEKHSKEILWISGKTSVLISGRTEDSIKSCQLTLGLATTKPEDRIRLYFDSLYIHDCGVQLQINESVTSDFAESKTNHEIFMSSCYTRNPGPLYAQPKNFVLIRLMKDSSWMEAYNFRLNVSLAEQLPKTGLDLHVLIIVGFVLVVIVGLAAILLFKYISRLSQNWHELRVEEAMTRAINIYNSQEPLEEPDLVYIRPGTQSPQTGVMSNGHSMVRSRTGGSEIAFVHSDGRVERFRPLDGVGGDRGELAASRSRLAKNTDVKRQVPESRHSRNSTDQARRSSLTQPERVDLDLTPARSLVTDAGDTASVGGCEMPPSYEEALEMPTPAPAAGASVDDESTINDDDEEGQDIAMGGRLELDYMNVGRGGTREGDQEVETDADGDGSGACDSEEALLSFPERSKQS